MNNTDDHFIEHLRNSLNQSCEHKDHKHDPMPVLILMDETTDDRSIALLGLAGDFFRDQDSRLYLRACMRYNVVKFHATHAGLMTLGYMKAVKPDDDPAPLTRAQRRQAMRAQGRKYIGRLQDDPDAEEMALVFVCTAERKEVHRAKVCRDVERGVWLGDWHILPGSDDEGMQTESPFLNELAFALMVVAEAKRRGTNVEDFLPPESMLPFKCLDLTKEVRKEK